MEKPKIKPTISVCLATRNEEGNIDRCLRSVRGWADEIVVVDGASTDMTVAIAKKHKAKVIAAPHRLMFHINKQLAIDNAKGEWILLLDADEEISSELKGEIGARIKNLELRENEKNTNPDTLGSRFIIHNSSIAGYWIPRKNIIFGKWIEHTGWWPDYQLRLFKKGAVKFPCESVHEHPQMNGKTGKLTEPLTHHHYQTVSQYLERLNRYTDNDVQALVKKGEKIEWKNALVWPWDEFIKRFVVWEGYKDGLHGLVLSLLQSFYRLIVLVKLWEMNKYSGETPPDILEHATGIIKRKTKEIQWWKIENKIHASKPLRAWWLKIIKKRYEF